MRTEHHHPNDIQQQNQQPVTSKDVAKLAGVSQSAVSRTFTPGMSVSNRMREKVLSASAALHYQPNLIARSLSTQRSRLIGVVVSYLENQFYPLVIEQLCKSLRAHHYHVMLFFAEEGQSEHHDSDLMSYRLDAIIVASSTLSPKVMSHCLVNHVPVIQFNRTHLGLHIDGISSSVVSDNEMGGRLVAKTLVNTGHSKIAYLAGLESSSTNRDRERGFVSQLTELGASLHSRAVGHYDFDAAVAATLVLFDVSSPKFRPDAIFVANDHMAFAVMDTLRHTLGLRIPQDVSVVGYDNVPLAQWASYNLTTIEQPYIAMADAVVDNVLSMLKPLNKANSPTQTPTQTPTKRQSHTVLPARLIERGTVLDRMKMLNNENQTLRKLSI